MLGPGFYNMDCMEAMKDYPDGYFDLAIVDPPYGIQADNFTNGSGASKDGGRKWGTAVRLRDEKKSDGRLNHGCGKLKGRMLNTSDCSWDTEIPPPEYFQELMRVSRNQIIWGGATTSLYRRRGGLSYGIKSSRGIISPRWSWPGRALTGPPQSSG